MSNTIVRNVALVTYGNLFLQGKDTEFDIDILVAHNCYGIDFVNPPIEGIAGSSKVLASDTSKWFSFLKNHGAKKLKLFYRNAEQFDLPDHISTAFVGGGSQWFIEVQYDNTSDLYLSDWTSTESMPGKTHYLCFNRGIKHLAHHSLSVKESREKLRTILRELSQFASEHVKSWVSNFENPLTTLDMFSPDASDEFLPAGIYSKSAHQLIEAAFRSDVFGGMGSWNDTAHMIHSEENQKIHAKLSEELYLIKNNAIVSGVNSYPN
jgi:hypothetical protein